MTDTSLLSLRKAHRIYESSCSTLRLRVEGFGEYSKRAVEDEGVLILEQIIRKFFCIVARSTARGNTGCSRLSAFCENRETTAKEIKSAGRGGVKGSPMRGAEKEAEKKKLGKHRTKE